MGEELQRISDFLRRHGHDMGDAFAVGTSSPYVVLMALAAVVMEVVERLEGSNPVVSN
jgi:hypothetical protein